MVLRLKNSCKDTVAVKLLRGLHVQCDDGSSNLVNCVRDPHCAYCCSVRPEILHRPAGKAA
jgi:hypothetical protein